MEKRFELKHYEGQLIDVFDNKLGCKRVMGIEEIYDLLNKQDKKIKELKSELNFKNNIIWDENDKVILCSDCYCLNNGVRKLLEDNRQLRQSQLDRRGRL